MVKDMTEGDPAKLIFNFTMPLIAGNIMQQLYGFVDTLIVGRFLGVDALAAVGASGAIMFLMISLNVGLSAGLTIYTGQRFGAKDRRGVHKSVAACMFLGTIIGVLMALFGGFYSREMLVFMNTPPEILDDAVSFITIFCWSQVIAVWFILSCNLIRALGDSKGPTLIMSAALFLNILIEPLFIVVFGWGIPGAAWGITVSQAIGLIISITYIWKKIPYLYVRYSDLTWDWPLLKNHLDLALPMGFQSALIAGGIFIVQVALNALGADAVASFAAGQRVDAIAIMPMMSFGIAMGAYTAQNYGAKNFDRIREGVRKCAQMSVAFSIAVGLINALFGVQLIELFVGEEAVQVVEYGRIFLLINGSTYFILSLLFVYRYTLQGVGQTMIPTVAGVMELVMRGIAALWLADVWGYVGVCLASPLAWLGSCVPLAIAYYATVYKKQNS